MGPSDVDPGGHVIVFIWAEPSLTFNVSFISKTPILPPSKSSAFGPDAIESLLVLNVSLISIIPKLTLGLPTVHLIGAAIGASLHISVGTIVASVNNVVSRVICSFLSFVSRICLDFLNSDGTVKTRMKHRFTSAQELDSDQVLCITSS
ncbi:hypothetical protein Tco_1519091 [Tanacetum coccineum]